jgi:hypothetical protein
VRFEYFVVHFQRAPGFEGLGFLDHERHEIHERRSGRFVFQIILVSPDFREIRVFRGSFKRAPGLRGLVLLDHERHEIHERCAVGSKDDALVLHLLVVAKVHQQAEFETSCLEVVVNLRPMLIV